MMKWKNKRVLVVGAGASGLAAEKFLKSKGADVVVWDDNVPNYGNVDGYFDKCVVSPGVPLTHPIVQKYYDKIISELDLGFAGRRRLFGPKIIAVTGTNGKTTTVNMIHDALGDQSVLCGNVGVPVTAVAEELQKKTSVIEVSSFQLEIPPRYFRPDIGVILNITQDHLERHGTMEEYAKCKARIGGCILILNRDDENIYKMYGCMQERLPHILWYSVKSPVRGCYLDGDIIYINTKGKNAKKMFSLSEFGETRPHMIQNILAVVLVCSLLKIKREAVIRACRVAVRPHRIEYVGKKDNVEFYNDSKATNIASTIAACKCFEKDINLLLGGIGKGQDFNELFAELPANVRNIFVFGRDADEIISASGGKSGVTRCTDLQDAVQRAAAAAKENEKGGIVLFSPACSSFDMFNNYEHRGEEFKKNVYFCIF